MNRIDTGMFLLTACLSARAAKIGRKVPFSDYARGRLENSAAVDGPPEP